MTEEEFLKQMKEWDVSPDSYNINAPVMDTSLNLLKVSDDEYTVFYQEKGRIYERQIFFTYEDALDYLYERIKSAVDVGKKYGFKAI